MESLLIGLSRAHRGEPHTHRMRLIGIDHHPQHGEDRAGDRAQQPRSARQGRAGQLSFGGAPREGFGVLLHSSGRAQQHAVCGHAAGRGRARALRSALMGAIAGFSGVFAIWSRPSRGTCRRLKMRMGVGMAVAATTAAAFATSASAQKAPVVRPMQGLAVLHRAHKVFSAPHLHQPKVSTVLASRPLTGAQTVLPVTGRRSTDRVHWLRVLLPGRPNGRTPACNRRSSG